MFFKELSATLGSTHQLQRLKDICTTVSSFINPGNCRHKLGIFTMLNEFLHVNGRGFSHLYGCTDDIYPSCRCSGCTEQLSEEKKKKLKLVTHKCVRRLACYLPLCSGFRFIILLLRNQDI